MYCFTFLRERIDDFSKKWTPKVEGAHFFFVDEKYLNIPLSYLFIAVNKSQFDKVKPKIIEEIEGMKKVKINGRRFFNGF